MTSDLASGLVSGLVSGLLVVDKPSGCTSHDVVARVRRMFPKTKVGHAGTLDPSATGVLLVGVGRGTRLLMYLSALPKCYVATVKFGVTTDSQDADGRIIATSESHLTAADVESVLDDFTGEIDQVPPMVSAVKIDGEPLYKAARRGEEVERSARRVHIYELQMEGFDASAQTADLRVVCSSGTYIRTLGADMGEKLGPGAHITSLRRTFIGSFDEAAAHPLDSLEAMPDDQRLATVIPLAQAMRDFPVIVVDATQRIDVSHGKPLQMTSSAVRPGELPLTLPRQHGSDRPSHEPGMSAGVPVAVIDEAGQLLAVYRKGQDRLKPAAVLI